MLQAMNTGHEGSMATVHANTPRDAISRLEQMIGMAGLPMTVASIRGQIAAAIRVIVQLSRLSDGKRRVMSIARSRVSKATSSRCRRSTSSCAPASRRMAPCRAISRPPACARASQRSHRHGHQNPRHLFRSLAAAVSMLFDLDPIYLVWLFVAVSAGLTVEAVYLMCYSRRPIAAASTAA